MNTKAAPLENHRILLRKLRLSDTDGLYQQIRRKEMTRWTFHIPHPYPQPLAAAFIRKSQRLWKAKKSFTFAVLLKETNRLIGLVSLNNVNYEHKCAELSYWTGTKYWGRGLTTEAARLVLPFAFHDLKLFRIYACTFGPNLSSQKVLYKCGFQLEGTLRQAVIRNKKRCDFLNFGLLKPEYDTIGK
jgi:[ribosomal protein S5]-alanine N-acetyltransferase